MKNPAALCSGVLTWVERREVEKRRMIQITAHGFRVCMDIIQDYYVEMVKKMRTFLWIPLQKTFHSWNHNCIFVASIFGFDLKEVDWLVKTFGVNFISQGTGLHSHICRTFVFKVTFIVEVTVAEGLICVCRRNNRSKAAIESYTCCLANEVKPFGISVTCVQPGDICTGFTEARRKSVVGDDVYEGRISRSVEGMEKDERNGMPPDTAGKYIAKIALKPHVKPIYTLGFGYKCLSLLCKILPCGLRNWIVGLLYAR